MRKDSKIISEIGSFFKKTAENKAINSILNVISNIRLQERQIGIGKKPNCKFPVLYVFQMLLLFPFFSVKNSFHFSDSGLSQLFSAEKDVFYRFLNDDNIKWRNLLYAINLQLITKLAVRKDSKDSKDPVCLIADDTDHPKTGIQSELIGKIHSHVENKSILGYKGLYLMRTDGKTQTVLDFSLHGEMGKNPNKPQGLTKKERDSRYTKQRDENCAVSSRISEYMESKLDCLIEQLKTAIHKKVKFDYLLVDSWFTCKELVGFIKKKTKKAHLLGMIKMGKTNYTTEFGDLTASEIVTKIQKLDKKANRKNGEKRIKYSRQYRCHYFHVDVEFDGHKVRLFFCKRGNNGKWKGVLSTNTKLSFMEAYKIYAMRWSIEVFNHEAKSLLKLGQCQSLSFSAQIASISIAILQYNILSVVKRFESYQTIGGLFNETLSGTLELSVTSKIWALLHEAITEIAEMISADADEFITAVIENNPKIRFIYDSYTAKQVG